jgi:hypothetical protein
MMSVRTATPISSIESVIVDPYHLSDNNGTSGVGVSGAAVTFCVAVFLAGGLDVAVNVMRLGDRSRVPRDIRTERHNGCGRGVIPAGRRLPRIAELRARSRSGPKQRAQMRDMW